MATFDGKDQNAFLKSVDENIKLDVAAIQLQPNSPYITSMSVHYRYDRSAAYVKLGRLKDSLAEFEAAVATARELVKQSPEINRNGNLLADALKSLAADFRRVDREADAIATFEESIQVIDGLVRRYPDRAIFASQWVGFRNQLADFFENGPKSQGEIQARQDLLRTLDQTVKRGRELAAGLSDHYFLQVNFADTLARRGRYDRNAAQNASALPYLLEGVEVYRTRIIDRMEEADEVAVNAYLSYIQVAASCANALSKDDELIRLSQLALEVRSRTKNHQGLENLAFVIDLAARTHKKAGRLKEAVQAFQQTIDVRRPAFEAAPWHWYLHWNLGDGYTNLADVYRLANDHRNEVLALREYLKLIIAPWWNTKVDEYVDPARPADLAEADRIRALIKKAIGSGDQSYTFNADYDGIKYATTVYVTNVTWPKHPLEDQARCLKETRGGTIPQGIMDEFGKYSKIAHDTNKPLLEVCKAQITVSADISTAEIEKLPGAPVKTASTKPADRSDADVLAGLQARLIDLKARLARSPGDLASMEAAAQTYEEYGVRRLAARQFKEGADALRASVRLRERLAREQPLLPDLQDRLAATLTLLAKAHVQLKDYYAAANNLVRRLDQLETLNRDHPSSARKKAIAETFVMLGELALARRSRRDTELVRPGQRGKETIWPPPRSPRSFRPRPRSPIYSPWK